MTPAGAAARDLVLGLGNPLMGDDGLGLEVVRRLQETYLLPEGLDVLEGGTAGLGLLDRLEGYGRVLVADCVAGEGEPGEVIRLGDGEPRAVFSQCLSPHDLGLNDLLAALELLGRRPATLTVVGIVPERVELGSGLSGPVQRALPALVEALARELRAWGLDMELRLPGSLPSSAAPAQREARRHPNSSASPV